jgi:hypothetical protein
MNFPTNKPSQGGVGNAGAVSIGVLGAASAQLSVGAVGFGPSWQDDEPTLREMYDAACASIIRLEQENQELRAEVALAEAERIEMAKMLRSEREAHAKCQNALETYRDDACRESCRDKAAADGGWGNI